MGSKHEDQKLFVAPATTAKQARSREEDVRLLWDDETSTRAKVAKGCGGNSFTAFLINGYSAILVFIFHLISMESLLSIGLSVYLTIYTYETTRDDDSFDGSVMSWTLLSFAIVTPMSTSIGMAFSRRERALSHMALIKVTLLNIYSAHACWDWAKPNKPGRDPDHDWLGHNDKILKATLQLCSELSRLLTLPASSRARHRVTSSGRAEAAEIGKVMNKLHLCMMERMAVLTDMCEDFKFLGLPPNEATRIRQWERMVMEKIEMLLMIKKYRTPQALRSFARLFTVFLPPFYAPYYGQMAKEINSLGMAIAFAVITSIALTSLFESISQIEDPFTGKVALDGIDVRKELEDEFRQQLLVQRTYHFSDAEPFQIETKMIGVQIGEE